MGSDAVSIHDSEGRDGERPVDEYWLMEPDHPSLAAPEAARLDDPTLPDRLTWNAFRTLALWNTDVWVPSLLEVALGDANPLSGLEWGDASVELWRSRTQRSDSVHVVIEGPEAVVLVEATFRRDLIAQRLAEGADQAVDLAVRDGRESRACGFVLLTPSLEGTTEGDFGDVEVVPERRAEGRGLRPEALERVSGRLTWADLAALALDLVEEADPMRREIVHILVTELQRQFPDLEV